MRRVLMGFLLLGLFSCASWSEKDFCKDPEYAKVKKDKARKGIEMGDLYAPLDDLQEAKRCNPRDPEVYYLLGQVYWKRQEREKAKENFQLALKYNPNYSETYLALGDMFLQENNFDFAIENYQKAANDDFFRNAYLAWNNLGWIYLQQDKLKEAEEALTRSLVLAPKFCNSHCNLGELRSKQKNYEAAVKEYQKAIELCPTFARPHRLLGLEYSRQGKFKEACQEFNLALKNAEPASEEAKLAREHLKFLNCPGSK